MDIGEHALDSGSTSMDLGTGSEKHTCMLTNRFGLHSIQWQSHGSRLVFPTHRTQPF